MEIGHYAKLDDDNIVIDVIKCADNVIDSVPGRWIKTSYNTKNGVHINGGTPLRANFAGIGFKYYEDLDAFIPPKPELYPSWVLNTTTFSWEAPIMCPNIADHYYEWDETNQKWLEFSSPPEDA
jgi:hypothetical protein